MEGERSGVVVLIWRSSFILFSIRESKTERERHTQRERERHTESESETHRARESERERHRE